jgi:hypothetical protein
MLLDGSFKTVATGSDLDWPIGQKTESVTIMRVWEISFTALSHPAKELLLLCGFMANGDIPDELFDLEQKLRFDWMGQGTK